MTNDPSSNPTSSSNQPLDPVQLIDAIVSRAIARVLPDVGNPQAMISRSRKPELGDFQSNAAMPLAKAHGLKPRDLAEQLVAAIADDARASDLLEPVRPADIAGPGFINLRLKPDAMASLLSALDSPNLGVEPPATPMRAVIDLVGVNLAKQMHVGHLRSMIVGDAIARALSRLGWDVIRQNHVGDWGLPIAMVTRKLADRAAEGSLDLDAIQLEELDALYREAQRDCAADTRGLEAARKWNMGPKAIAELEAQVSGAEEQLAGAKETLLKLQAHEPETMAIWQRIADRTLAECIAVCDRLNVAVTAEHSAGESSYAGELEGVVADLIAKGIAEDSDGALVVRLDGLDQPCLIRKSDGGYLYATTDVAAIRRRVQDMGADRMIYCVDARQSLHFRQVFGVARRAGYDVKPGAGEPSSLEHAAFGVLLGEDHRPFRTRSGDNVKLADLLDEADQRAEAVVASKNPALDPSERTAIAHAVAIAAMKYADLSNERIKDCVFSFDRMLAFEGDTGPYLLYALVRMRSILRKAGARGIDIASGPLAVDQPAERTLALALLRYPGVLQQVGETLEPHRLCAFLYELASAFSSFFDACPVLAADSDALRASRLRLCLLTERVLADGLETLGIDTVDRM